MSNKKFSKKLLAAAMATAMAATMLAGCGDKTTTTTPDSSAAATTADSSAAASTEAPKGDPVEITIFRDSFNLNAPDQGEVDAVVAAINEYIKDKINVKISGMTDVGNLEFPDKANLALSNGEINLLWTASWTGAVKTDELIKGNACYDFSDLLPGTALYSAVPAWVWDACKYDGKDYFVSCYKESAEGYNLMFRQDLVDKYGWDLSTVKSYKDIEPMLADCKSEGLKYPYLTQRTALFYRWYMNDFDFFSQDCLVAVDRATDTVVNPMITTQYKEFVTTMCDWGQKGYISEDDATKTTPEAVTSTQDWGISFWTDVPDNSGAESRYTQKVAMAQVTDDWSHSNSALGSCFTIASTCTEEQAKACIEFLGLLYTDKTLADLYTYGIEGVDYDRDDAGKIVKKGELYSHDAWESCSQWCVSLTATQSDNLLEMYSDFNDNAKASSAAGFRFTKAPVDAEYVACTNVFAEYGYMLENGANAPDEVEAKLAKFQSALDEAGYQKILAEAQSQYEAWKATK
ncbi:MAG TPA: ABC transporter substrate-binding protein [Lachnospiraceae bacterium]|nr:ABC transporter substrate-binding protein [Lachnospiraceae bacterium]